MTIFSRIIAGDIPTSKIYEDELCIAILDINPIQKGHTLVIPKQEIIWLQDLPSDLLNHCMTVCQKIMKSMITNIPCDFI
jgi:histidine triad (HIT) family protein